MGTDERTHGGESAIDDDLTAGVDLPPPSIGERINAQRVRFTPEAIALIEKICDEEGATVTLTGSDPDNNGLPNEAVTVCNDDTEWQDRIFRRDTIEEALQAAIDYRGDDPEGARDLIRAMSDYLDGALGASKPKVSERHALWLRAQRFLGERP